MLAQNDFIAGSAVPVWSFEESIRTDRVRAKHVLEVLLSTLRDWNWTTHDVFCVHLAVEEAMTNSIRHGNQMDPSKAIYVSFVLFPTLVRVVIADEGTGFDYDSLPDPTADENLENPGGRGIYLIRKLMTRVEFNRGGTRLMMEKRCEPPRPKF